MGEKDSLRSGNSVMSTVKRIVTICPILYVTGGFKIIVTVHRFRVQRSGLRTKKGLKARSPR